MDESKPRVLRILLVEDHAVDAELVEDLLPPDRYAVTRVCSAAAARKQAQESSVDVVLLDLGLPDSHGVDTVDRIQDAVGGAPIIVVAGEADDGLAQQALRLGAQDYLIKGRFGADALIRSIRHTRERQRLQNELLHANRLAAVGRIATSVAHEINNPAAWIVGNLHLLERSLDRIRQSRRSAPSPDFDPADTGVVTAASADNAAFVESKDLVQDCLEGMDRICSISRQMLIFSRYQTDETGPVDMTAVIGSACKFIGKQIRHRARLAMEFEPDPWVHGRTRELTQVVVNLLGNAAQAVKDGDRESNVITIRCGRREDKVVLSVEDTGVGIEQAIKKKIFLPFFTTKRDDRGVGLGLFLCDEIVRRHGGRITVDSEPGRGSRFDVILPAVPAPAVKPRRPMRRPSTNDNKALDIVVIDDEPMFLKTIRRLLEPHQVTAYDRCSAALASLDADQPFDLLLCDLMTPGMDCIRLYDDIRDQFPHLVDRIIFTTGGAFTSRADEFLASIDNEVLIKPVSVEMLEKTSAWARAIVGATQPIDSL